ncbi:MAG: RND family transporter [Deltaproteobacteria bacterium]|uniref:RND family transporter n=1 Tax=Candidatus Zymogenus saltonus TaxID=2844893 RepID=A0A9D8PN86_9DELT|nr:RND family transporter [Candidatus Zymogenus saltonus]
MNRVTDFIIKMRIPILIFVFIVTVFFAFQLKDLRIDNSVEGFVVDDDPDKIYFEKFRETFGSDELIIIGFEVESVFDSEFLSLIDKITRKLEKYKYIDEVISLTNVKEIRGSEGLLEVNDLINHVPTSEEEMKRLMDAVYENPLHLNYLIDEKERVTAIYAILPEKKIEERLKEKMVEDVREMLNEVVPDNIDFYVAGTPPIKRDMGSFLKRDQMVFTPLTFFLMALILYLAYRSVKCTVLPLFMVIIVLTWALGFIAITGRPITVVLSMLQPLLIVMTVAHSIHLLSHYNENNLMIEDKFKSLRTTLTHMLLPCSLTTITTAFGFSSLGISKIPPIKDFGFFTAIGVVFAFAIVLTVVPIILFYIKAPKVKVVDKKTAGLTERVLKGLLLFVMKRKVHVVLTCILITAFSIFGIFKIEIETDFIKYFKKDSDIYVSTFFIQEHLTGTSSLNVVIEGNEEGVIKEPRVLYQMEKLQKYLESKPQVRKTISILDFLKDMNKAMHDGDPKYYTIPETRNLVAQYLLLYSMSGDPDDFDRFVDFTYEKGTVTTRLIHMSSQELRKFINETKDYCENNFTDDLTVRVTGDTVLYNNMDRSMVDGQIKSILLALFTIFLVMSLVFRSFYLGSLSMIPNLIPIFLTLGLMGWMGIHLNTSTIMIGSVAIGIAVDDTIHFMTRYFREIREGRDVESAIKNTLMNTGKPIIFTTMVVGSGFFVLLFASFVPVKWFGSLTAFTMFSALIGDLIVLPVILLIARPKFRGWGSFMLDK